jgi:hypothetical protein
MDVQATDTCANCGDEFANHNYVPDSIDQYKCPHPHVESGYGAFCGGDPRTFHPDGEMCSPDEIENHRKACELWDEAEACGETPEPEKCPSGWIYDENGKAVCHVLRTPYGIGGYTIEMEQFWEPREFDPEEDDECTGDE